MPSSPPRRRCGEQPFLVLNADNLYPVAAIRALAELPDGEAAVVAFDRDALTADGAIEPARIGRFAILDLAADGTGRELLRAIVEKPGDAMPPGDEAARWVGMNLWRVTPALVAACRAVPRSARGEFELPEAVSMAVADGLAVRVVRSREPVLDLSHRRDIAAVAARLRGVPVST